MTAHMEWLLKAERDLNVRSHYLKIVTSTYPLIIRNNALRRH